MTSSKLFKISAAVAAALSITACIPGSGGGGDTEGGAFLTGSAAATAVPPVADAGTVGLAWTATLLEDDFIAASFTTSLYVSATNVPGLTADYTVTQSGVFNGFSTSVTGTATCTYAKAAATLTCTDGVTPVTADISAALAAGNGSVYLMAKTCMTGTASCTTLTGNTTLVAFDYGRSYTDAPAGDAAITAVDITTASINGNATTTNVSLAMAGGFGTALPINQGNVADGAAEYEWGAILDVNGDGAISDGDYKVALVHNHVTGGAASALISDGTQFVGELQLMSGGLWVAQAAAVSATVNATTNTIDLSVATPAGVAPGTNPVRFETADNSAAAPVTDALPDLGAGTAVGGNFNL